MGSILSIFKCETHALEHDSILYLKLGRTDPEPPFIGIQAIRSISYIYISRSLQGGWGFT